MRTSKPSGLGRFVRALSDNRGNVAVVVALAMGPLAIAGLGAVDLARATSAKSQLQDALDAAALAAARTNSTTDAQLKVAGDKYLKQNLALSSAFVLTSSTFKFGDNGRVLATARLDVTPFVAGLMTGGTMPVGASAEVVRAGSKLEIALVLDNTGSMNEGDGAKLTNLKAAATEFVTKMEEISKKATEADTVRISLVPFSNSVRVDGTAYRYAAWIDQSGASPVNDEIFTTATGVQHANRFDLFTATGQAWRGCVEMRQAPYDVQDTAPTTGATLYTPFFAVDEPDGKSPGYGDDYLNDYLPDTGSSTDWRVLQGRTTKYGGTKKSSLNNTFGPNRGCELKKVMRLTTDFSALRTAITGLTAAGNTNIPIGMAWGWNTISPYAPFSDGIGYNTSGYKKIVVLMTDGENTMDQRDTPNDSSYAGAGYIWQGRLLKANGAPLPQGASGSQRTAALDSRLSLICTNMKAKGIEIYTIRVEDGSSTLLKACASSDDHYYNVDDSDTLTAVFQSIAGQIAALHLSK